MDIKKRGKKLVHEHEAFLFSFVLIFLFGGFIFWNVNASALVFTLEDGTSLTDGTVITYGALALNEKSTTSVTIVNDGEDILALHELDVQCQLTSAEDDVKDEEEADNGKEKKEKKDKEENKEKKDKNDSAEDTLGCSSVTTDFVATTLYPGDAFDLAITVSSATSGSLEGTLNFVVSDGITSFSFTATITDETTPTEDDENEETLIDKILALLTGETDETVEEVPTEEPVVPVVSIQHDVGLTASSMNFGNLQLDEQQTKTMYLENLLAETPISFGDLAYPPGYIVTLAPQSLSVQGQRATLTVTCSPAAYGLVADKEDEETVVSISTNRGDIVLPVSCYGSTGESAVILDEEPPTVTFAAPTGQDDLSGNVLVKAFATDPSGVAVVKFYVSDANFLKLIRYLPAQPYKFYLDTTTFANGPYRLTANALDNHGNEASAHFDIFINNPEEEIETHALTLVDVPETVDVSYDVGDGVTSLTELISAIDVVGQKAFDLTVAFTHPELGDLPFVFNDASLSDDVALDLSEVTVERKTKEIRGHPFEMIDISNEDLMGLIDTFNAESVTFPMPKPDSYATGNMKVYYLYDDGRRTDITEKILSVTPSDHEDIIYVTVPVSIITG